MRKKKKQLSDFIGKETVFRLSLLTAAFIAAAFLLLSCSPNAVRPMEASAKGLLNLEAVSAEAPENTEEPTADNSAAPSIKEFEWKQIYYGSPAAYDDSLMLGECRTSSIDEIVDTEQYGDRLFAIRYWHAPFGSLKRLLYSSSPISKRFLEEYEQWEPYKEFIASKRVMVNSGQYEDDLLMEQFKSIWKEQNSASDWEEFCIEEKKIRAVLDDYSAWQDSMRKCRELEVLRLDKLGYKTARCSMLTEPCLFLTKEQIESFPALEDDSYWLFFGAEWQETELLWKMAEEGITEENFEFIREQMPRPVEFLSALGMLG